MEKATRQLPWMQSNMDPIQSNILDLHHMVPKKDGGIR